MNNHKVYKLKKHKIYMGDKTTMKVSKKSRDFLEKEKKERNLIGNWVVLDKIIAMINRLKLRGEII